MTWSNYIVQYVKYCTSCKMATTHIAHTCYRCGIGAKAPKKGSK